MATIVLHLSDTHLTEAPGAAVAGVDPERRLAIVLATWAATGLEADVVVLGGDNADDGSAGAYHRLAEAVAPLGARMLAVAGNHDLAAPLATAFDGPASIEAGGWRLMGFDSSRPGDIHGTLDVAGALARLDRCDDRPTVVVVHHPPASPSTHPWFRLDGGAELLRGLADRPHVKAVLSGHLHLAFELRGPGGLALWGCPSTLVAFTHHGDHYARDPHGTTGARLLHLGDDGTVSSTLLRA